MSSNRIIFGCSLLMFFLVNNLSAQNIAVNTTGAAANTAALLDVGTAAGGDTKGILIPRVALTDVTLWAPVTPAGGVVGMLVYNTATAGVSPNNVVPGFYYWNGSKWVSLSGGSGGNDWSLLGNSGTTDGTNFIGTTDSRPFNIKVANQKSGRIDNIQNNNFFGYQAGQAIGAGTTNTAIGSVALYSNTTGSGNTASGDAALFTNISGGNNTATGQQALYQSTGDNNTATGFAALYNNGAGGFNTSMGNYSLYNNIAGSNGTAVGVYSQFNTNNQAGAWTNNNTSVGYGSLYGSATPANNTGVGNTAIGYQTLYSNSSGTYNTADGVNALYSNTSGLYNTASGYNALFTNTTGSYNTVSGVTALYSNLSGVHNTASGYQALYSNNSGSLNIAIGVSSLYYNTSGADNTGVGVNVLTNNRIGSDNTAVGLYALYSNYAGNKATAIGVNAMFYANSTVTAFDNYNVAVGYEAVRGSTTAASNTGNWNTGIGYQALQSITSGNFNAATGSYALQANTTGISNAAYGVNSLLNNNVGSQNTAFGANTLTANTNGNWNTALGYNAFFAGASYSNSTALGYNAVIGASNKVRIGDALVTVIEGQVAYSFPSDGRFKNNVSEEVKGLDFINKLRPIIYNFDTRKFDAFLMKNIPDSTRSEIMNKKDYNQSTSIRQSGFIAQEVERAAIESGYNFNGVHKPENENDNYSVSYSLFVVPLVKAVQEQQKMIDELKTQNAQQLLVNQQLVKEIKKIKTQLSSEASK